MGLIMTDLQVKRVYDPPDPSDGTRVLVDRLWPRGLTKEKAKLDLWLREIAPSDDLRKRFRHEPELWEEFQRHYHDELRGRAEAVGQLKQLAAKGRVTLLYAAQNQTYNNAVALANWLRKRG